jgi:hypothetical protein
MEVICMTKMQVEWQRADEEARHNKASEEETVRHNIASEELTKAGNELRQAELNETIRSHQTNEGLTLQQLNETIRHQQAIDAETMRHNGASEAEIAAHNRATEQIDRDANTVKLMCQQIAAAATRDAAKSKADATRYTADVNKDIAKLKIAAQSVIEAMKDKTQNRYLDIQQSRTDSQNLYDKARIRDIERRYFLDYDKWQKQLEENQRRLDRELEAARTEEDKRRALNVFNTTAREIAHRATDTGDGLVDRLNNLWYFIHHPVQYGVDKGRDAANTLGDIIRNGPQNWANDNGTRRKGGKS